MTSNTSHSGDGSPRRNWRKWIVGGLFLVFFAAVMWTVINPYRGQRFEKIPHGDHVHFVPKDRNPDVPVGRFPTRKPAKDERITPDGKVVPIRSSGQNP